MTFARTRRLVEECYMKFRHKPICQVRRSLEFSSRTFYFHSNLAKYDWPLTKVSNSKLQERLTSRQGSVMTTMYVHTKLGVLTRKQNKEVSLGSYTGQCVGNLDNCNKGLSFTFWMNYNGKEICTGTCLYLLN